MSPLAIVQLIGCLACLAGLAQVVTHRSRLGNCVCPMASLVLAVGAARMGLGAWEHHGGEEIEWIDAYTDAIGAVWPLTWFFLFYGVLLEQQRRAMEEQNERLSGALVELRQAQDCLTRDERLRAIGEMSAGVAHDFNNRLTLVLSNAELLLSGQLDPDERAIAERIVASAEDAAAVVRRMNAFYRPSESVRLDWIDGLALLRECADFTRPHWSHEGQIEVRVQDGGPADFVGCRHELLNALVNLVMNAVDALPGGGWIELRAGSSDEGVVLEVRDNGEGMDAATASSALEPFFSTKPEGTGTGLGLSIVRTVAESHGGRVELESESGQGTTVRLVLPPVQLARQVPPVDDTEPVARGLNVLVIDDNEHVRRILREILETDGQSVVEAGDGVTGYEALVSGPVDVVLLDRVMPEVSGDEVARQMKDIAPGVPIVMMTGFGNPTLDDGFLPPCVDASLDKPVSRSTLRRTLATVCRGSETVER